MTHRRVAVGIITALTVLVGACSQNTQGSDSPSSSLAPLSIPSTTMNSASNSDGDGDSASVPPASVAPEEGASALNPSEVLSTITVNQVGACVDGQGTLLVSHDPRASTVMRQITAIIDGTQTSSDFSSGAAQFEVGAVACDDRIHTVLIATIGLDGSTQSRAFAVRISS